MTKKEQIKQLFEEHKELTVNEIINELVISKQMTHLVLNDLLNSGYLEKIGRTPKTIYRIVDKSKIKNVELSELSEEQNKFLDTNFVLITEIGQILTGAEGFKNWCDKRKLPFQKTTDEFIVTKQKYNNYLDKNTLISGIDKLKNTKGYENIYLDELLYLDFYAIERFGKTKLGTILHYGKQGQNKMLIKMLVDEIKVKIQIILTECQINAIAYVPPTIKRETQLMKVLANGLKISLPQIEIQKISGIIPVPQKSLNKLEERIANADNTFSVRSNAKFDNILLIDDAVGSGSTLNQIAKKIKSKGIAKKIIGLAIVGSYKGFDVITDV